MKFDAESQEAMHGSLRRKGNHGEKEVMEEDQEDDISKEGDIKNESVEDLSEEEACLVMSFSSREAFSEQSLETDH